MKATGIVRRIDDLGRVVIPKEIRRTMHIREGDPLEIFTDSGGEVVFKKYSPIGEFAPFATQYADVLARAMNMSVAVADRDGAVAAAGPLKKELMGKRLSAEAEKLLTERQPFIARSPEQTLLPFDGMDKPACLMFPILAAGDMAGTVCAFANDVAPGTQGALPGETDVKLMQVTAAFLGKQMEG
ncbi:MAG: AbrB/MazE/SpoVT family DNA-binding domain-containing protein [Oscillospiraceae bacterium]|nr:AbrB/MazE/SpoVT family DNA-binding domain-containing protein [Oscillospiraceae bacterium]